MKPWFRSALAAIAAAFTLSAPLAAPAAVVNLDNLALGNGQSIQNLSPGYGSEGPVTLNWDPLSNANLSILHWNGGYSGRNAGWCASGSSSSCVLDLTVASGFSLTLDSFFLGGYFNTNRLISWSVVDLGTMGSVASAVNSAVSGVSGLVNTIGATSTTGFRIFFGPDGFNGGINDITYSYAPINPSAVPLPAAGWLMLAGFGGLVALRRRQQRAA